MGFSIPTNTIEGCFELMRNWDAEAKKEMIIRLLHSLESKTKSDLSDCCGAWQDDRDADEIIDDIYKNRRNRANMEEF